MMHRDARLGLTLLETLVALALTAILAGLLSTAIGLGVRSSERSDRIERSVEQAVTRRKLRDWIEHALPSEMPNQSGRFEGSTTELRFLADIAAFDPRFQPGRAVVIAFNSELGAFVAQIEETGHSHESIGEVVLHPSQPETELRFHYWGVRREGSTPDWHGDWSDVAGVPLLVRIDFIDSDVPPMVVQPAKAFLQTEISLSSLVPPALPSRP